MLLVLVLVLSTAMHAAEAQPACRISPSSNTSQVPFSGPELKLMMSYLAPQVDVGGTGGLAASPDTDVGPDVGSYFYHWQRDAALTMRVLLQVASDPGDVFNIFQSYLGWIQRVQKVSDPHGIDVLGEPKFNLPDNTVFAGGWCRPQNDGPALRATTLMTWLSHLEGTANFSKVAAAIWNNGQGPVPTDLDWLVNNWKETTCDLWEDLESNDFFWNRMVQRRAFETGAKLAAAMGDTARASTYTANAQALRSIVASHWNGQFVIESANRLLDGAVIAAFNDGQIEGEVNPPYPFTSPQVASTVSALSTLFCNTFPINSGDDVAGVPGILFGRYQGDVYQGGNPWILLTAALAELFYRGASEAALAAHSPPKFAAEVLPLWNQVIASEKPARNYEELASAMLAAGDGVMLRIRYHTAGAKFHMGEQLDKNSGYETSAYDLSWSYGTVLKAMHFRAKAVEALK